MDWDLEGIVDWGLDGVVANLPAALFRGYADGRVELFDRRVETITGYAREEFESGRIKWTELILPEDFPEAKRAFVDALRGTRVYTREYRVRSRSAGLVWIQERSQIRCDPTGAIQDITGLFFDVTDRKHLEQALHDAERQLRIVIANIPAVMFKGYLDGTVDLFDDKTEALIGYRAASFGRKGMKWTDLIVEEDRQSTRSAFIRALKTNGSYVREYRVKAAHGSVVWIHERSQIVVDEAGRAAYVSGFYFDVTERKRLEATVAEKTAELQQANERLLLWARELERRNSEINLLGQMGELLQSCNRSEEAYQGIQRFLAKLFPEDSGALFVAPESTRVVEAVAVWGARPPEEKVFSVDECWGLRRGRAHGREEIQAGFRCQHVGTGDTPYFCVPMTAHGAGLGVLHVLLARGHEEQWDVRRDLAVRVAEHLALALAKLKLQETLQHLSVLDPLTGLFNRRYMEETLARELRRAERGRHCLGVIMLDIDHFKRFNDTLGHDAGDTLLRELAAMLQRQVRASDIACRYGGEEFTMILPDVPPDLTRQRAEEIREAAREMRVQHGPRLLSPVTLSLGVAVFPQNGTTRDALLQNADVALYRAKHEGRDRVCVAEGG
jgi:diguanylate cyclase (GGDEF)-like protein/PAS domain S-box-containing protein